MPDGGALNFVGGAVMGLASSLHCAGMCGGVAASLMFTLGGCDRRARRRALLTTQAGRVSGYVLAGCVVGGAGASAVAGLDHPAAYALLRWMAAAALGWIGLSMLGLVPSLAFADRLMAPMIGRLWPAGASAPPNWSPFILGVGWSLTPCGMALGALVHAALSGSIAGGATVMAGFGIGTLPAILTSALGFEQLRTLSRQPALRLGAGCLMVLLAVLSVVTPNPVEAIFCLG